MDPTSIDPEDLGKIKDFAKLAWDAMPRRLKKSAKDYTTSAWNNVSWSRKAELYLEALYRRIHSTRILGKTKEIRVAEIYTDVFIYKAPLRTGRRHILTHDAAALRQKRFDDEGLRRPAEEILNEKRLYLLGKPGAGKTTLLRYLSLQAIFGERKWTPIYIPLKDVVKTAKKGDDVDLLKFIEDQFRICELPDTSVFVNELMQSGRATLMLDGLDEVTEAKGIRKKLIFDTELLADRLPRLKIIMTSRVGAEAYSFDTFASAQIADFSPEQQVYFVKRWYAHDPTLLSSFVGHWKLPENQGLRDLASTPLLLALLCIGFDETREFPLRRSDLYEEAVTALLQDWSVKRGIERDNPFPTLTASRKSQMLSFVGFELFRRNDIIFTPRQAYSLIRQFIATLPRREQPVQFEASDIVNHIEAAHGLLVHETSDYLAFSHLTIHEYFVATFLIDTTNENDLSNALVFENLRDRRWREVYLLATGLITSANYILSKMRSELGRALSNDPHMAKILNKLTQSGEEAIVWGDWASRPQLLTGNKARSESGYDFGHFSRQMSTRFSSILAISKATMTSTRALSRVEVICANLTGSHAMPAFVYFGEGGRSRIELLFAILEVEDLYAQVLGTGTVSSRATYEEAIFSYS